LKGTIKVHGAKNAVLPIITATILGQQGVSIIHEVPALDDVETIANVLADMGVQIDRNGESLLINAEHLHKQEAPLEWVKKMRASILVMGPLLARFGSARVAIPGGCAIGARPIDQHIKGFEAMGATFSYTEDFVEARLPVHLDRLQGAKIYLDFPSVGATENIMMAATLAQGTTIIDNAAREPEIVDLSNMLNAMGANVRGAGTPTIRIEGVKHLHAVEHSVIPDRIEAGTYLIAGAITGGHLQVEGAISDHLNPLIAKLREVGVEVTEHENSIEVKATQPLRASDLKTLPYPGFPTDLQAQMMALLMTAEGTSVITETIFENRFMHVNELKQFQADISIDGRQAVIRGGRALKAAKVCATDLRAGAALVLAALVAEGESEITGLHHIDRGYVHLTEKLRGIGAKIDRIESEQSLQVLIHQNEII
jgi:UDP-N-acetylglucosamine 1-carboxyvinyltransferase